MRVRDDFFSDISDKNLLDINNYNSKKDSAITGIIRYKLNSESKLIFSGYNPNCSAILGVDCEQYINLPIEDAFPALVGTGLIEKYKEVATTGNSWGTEYVEYNDKLIGGAFKLNVYQIEHNQIIIAFSDITKQKIGEIQNNETFSLLNTIYKGVEHLIFVLAMQKDGSFKFVDVNPAFEKIVQISVDKIRGKTPNDFIHKVSEESIEKANQNYTKCI